MAKQRRTFWRGDKRFWSPIAITSGLTIFFFGITYVATNTAIGAVDIVVGLVLIGIGFSAAPIRSNTG